ncbi:SAP domain-containing protein [Corallococcus terminator]
MRLVDLLAALDQDTFERLSHHFLELGEAESRAAACVNLENILRSPKHVRETIYNLQPPAFWILEKLLDVDAHSTQLSGLKEHAIAETLALSRRVSSGQLLGRNEGLSVYRHVLLEARRNELELDASEAALLGVLRRELKIRQVEHFLIEHHGDFYSFWNTDHAFLAALNGLRSSGVAYITNGSLVFPEDLVAIARQVLGIEAGADARKRLFERLSGNDTSAVLDAAELRTTGTKDEKCQRLVENYIQPSEALGVVSLGSLRDLCRDLDLGAAGPKDELIARLVRHFALAYDIRPKPAEPPPPPLEPRVLTPAAFDTLFGAFRGQDLSDILAGIDANRVTGTKEHLVRLLRESRLGEAALLMELDLRQLEAVLSKHQIKTGGAKREKIQRLLEFFSTPPSIPERQQNGEQRNSDTTMESGT